MSLSAPFIPIAFKDALDQTEPYWDYIIGNESEAQSWAQAHNLEVNLHSITSSIDPSYTTSKADLEKTDDIPTIAEHLANLPKANTQRPRVALITQGSSPTIFAISGIPGYKQIPVRSISGTEIIDTTGAG
jgi:adenosine kinase